GPEGTERLAHQLAGRIAVEIALQLAADEAIAEILALLHHVGEQDMRQPRLHRGRRDVTARRHLALAPPVLPILAQERQKGRLAMVRIGFTVRGAHKIPILPIAYSRNV